LSRKNLHRRAFALALAAGRWEDGGSTGLTLQALLQYLEEHPAVQMLILENVPGLLTKTVDGSPYSALKNRLERLGPFLQETHSQRVAATSQTNITPYDFRGSLNRRSMHRVDSPLHIFLSLTLAAVACALFPIVILVATTGPHN
jgi:hypothetical protein